MKIKRKMRINIENSTGVNINTAQGKKSAHQAKIQDNNKDIQIKKQNETVKRAAEYISNPPLIDMV